jgi:hypothetical protein
MPNAFDELRAEFLREAGSAPRLFQDLANVEKYIAETYKSRAFIELIQNADDARASKFGIYDFGAGFAVGNDGVPFTVGDIEALCRSGSSAKRRGGSTIGYRGIGFKSVVNLAKTVYAFSGNHRFYFNRDATRRLLADASDVPLIRVPHPVEGAGHEIATAEAARLMRQFGYRTVFVFQEPNVRLSSDEFLAFDRSCLLFLNNLRHVDLSFGGRCRSISVSIPPERGASDSYKITEGEDLDEWEVLPSSRHPKNVVALKKVGDAIVPASLAESVFHSFTPTTQFAGAFLKINGDYSTDPSRKTIDADESSQRSFDDTVCTIADAVISLMNQETAKKGFFTPFVNTSAANQVPTTLRLLPALAQALQLRKITIPSGGGATPFAALRLKPEWIGYEDYEKLCHTGVTAVPKAIVRAYPEVMSFLEQMGIHPLSVQDVTDKLNGCEISPLGRVQIAGKCVKQYRFDLGHQRVESLRKVRLFQGENGPATAEELKSASKVAPAFTKHLLDDIGAPDVRFFYNKLGLELDDPAIEQPSPPAPASTNHIGVAKDGTEAVRSMFKTVPAIKQWRSAEKNAEAFISALSGVMSVVDVSTANLGYDLEVTLQTGRRLYVDVKSVSSVGEPFRLTNNEYSSAHSYGDNYFVAVVINGETFDLRLIKNPIKSLQLQKQCERWCWYCDQYVLELVDPSAFASAN